MKKIIWIYGDQATGKTSLANLISDLLLSDEYNFISGDELSEQTLKKTDDIKLLAIDVINEYDLTDKKIEILLKVSKVIQVIVLSQYQAVALKDYVIQLKTEKELKS